jgi:hypothetical protein
MITAKCSGGDNSPLKKVYFPVLKQISGPEDACGKRKYGSTLS